MRRTGASVPEFLARVPDERRRQDALRLCAMMQEITVRPPCRARDAATATRLWAEAERLTDTALPAGADRT
jgi:hypothetical protein